MLALPLPPTNARRPTHFTGVNKDSSQYQNLIAWWPLGFYGPDVGLDKSVGGADDGHNTALGVGTPSIVTDRTGICGAGIDFSADTDYLRWQSDYGNLDAITIAAWVIPTADAPAAQGRIVHKKSGATSDDWHLGYRLDRKFTMRVRASDNFNATHDGTVDVTLGNLYLVVGRWDHTDIRMYIDGVESGTPKSFVNSNPTDDTNQDGAIGRHRDQSDRSFPGEIYDVKIWDRALSDTEIYHLFDPSTRWDLHRPNRVIYI